MQVEETPKEYLEELNAQIDLDRKILGKKPFGHNDDDKTPKSCSEKTQMKILTIQKAASRAGKESPTDFITAKPNCRQQE